MEHEAGPHALTFWFDMLGQMDDAAFNRRYNDATWCGLDCDLYPFY